MKKRWLKFFLFIIFILTVIFIKYFVINKYFPDFKLSNLQQKISSFGWYAPFAFILIYSSFILFLIPGSLLTVIGGLIFGVYFGTLYSMTSAMIGSSLAFLISRYFIGDWAKQKTSNNKLNKLITGVEEHGWQFVAFLRLVPIFPFTLLNYLFGLTPIKFSTYFFTSLIFMLPGCITYTYLGSLGIDLASGEANKIITKVLIISILFAFMIIITQWVRKYFKDKNGKIK